MACDCNLGLESYILLGEEIPKLYHGTVHPVDGVWVTLFLLGGGDTVIVNSFV